MMDIPKELIAVFPPLPDLLLDRARRQIDDGMLLEIARADYGHMADEMLAELLPIREKGIVPAPMHGQLAEVLSLSRWSNPEVQNRDSFEPGPANWRGYLTSLFASAVLMRADAEPATRYQDNAADSTLAQCLVSSKALGEDMSKAAAQFLTWRIPGMEASFERLLFALGLLILATRLRSGRIADHILGTTAEWVLAEESLCLKAFPSNPANPRPIAFSLMHGFWQSLAAELRTAAADIFIDEVRTNLQLCALLLEPGQRG